MRMKAGFASMLGLLTTVASAQTAPDATAPKPGVAVSSFEYYIPGFTDTEVAPIPIDLWARVYVPSGYAGQLPLVVLLHGNHATCGTDDGLGPARRDDNIQYTLTGTCPPRYVVIPNHAGYEYLARPLATWGYIVVSINANRGVTAAPGLPDDRGLNLRRGRLVLRHLQKLVELNATASSPLYQKIDSSHVGLMGHSRGGEGMRAAYEQYRAQGSLWPARIGTPVGFEALFEIGPVDGQTGPRTNPNRLNADGLAWTVLLPNCDGDVFNLQGVKPFDRMMLKTNESPARFKATYTAWGTNHNFYNTEWQFSDSPGCLGQTRLFPRLLGSADQRLVSSASFLAFMRGNVGASAQAAFNQNFNPQFALPAVVSNVTRVDRGYTDSPSETITTVFDDFPVAATNTYAANGMQFTLGQIPQHDGSQRAAAVSWSHAGASVFFQSTAASPRDLSAYHTLEFRVSRQCHELSCHNAGPGSHSATNFSIQLVTGSGQASSGVQLQDYVSLTGPVGSLTEFAGTLAHPILMTARIPLTAFAGANLSQARAVRFVFDDTNADEIYIANIRASSVGEAFSLASTAAFPTDDTLLPSETTADQNTVSSMRAIPSSAVLDDQPGVEISLTSNRQFLPAGEMLVLRIGDQEFDVSRYSDDGSTNQITFVLTDADFASLKQGDQITVQYGDGGNGKGWKFGGVDKSMLK
jgi:hypothetical protein